MSTFAIIAIPFFITACVLLGLNYKKSNPAFRLVGGIFMLCAVLNIAVYFMAA